MASVYLCASCRQELQPDDVVVGAARQQDVTTQDSGGVREYMDAGPRSLFHEHHWYGDTAMMKERARGTLAELTRR